jgi:RimJ/RimL family protein N-acetyltransferase
MQTFPQEVRLRDGTTVVLRPMQEGDLDRSHRFFRKLPEADRLHLRMDLTDRANVRIRMEATDALEHWRLIALQGEEIVGDATLHRPRYGWMRHTGEIRCIVARELQGRGLGGRLLNELFQEATRRGVERLRAEVTPDETAALRILERLGFHAELTLRDRRRGPDGVLRDVIVMTTHITQLWNRLADLMQAMDGEGRERH